MTIVKQGTSDWLGNDRKTGVKQQHETKISGRLLVVVRGFFVSIWCDLRGLVIKGNHLVGNWPS